MRSRFLTAAALVALIVPAFAQSGTMTQSLDSVTVTPGTFISCQAQNAAGTPIFSNETSHWRSYNIINEGVFFNIDIASVSFGIEQATAAPPATSQTIEIHLYSDPNPDPAGLIINAATLVPIHTEFVTVPDQSATVLTVPMSATASFMVTETVVVEIRNLTLATGGFFFQGGNANGETANTFVSSPACGISPQTYAAVGIVGSAHAIIDLNWVMSGTMETYPGSGEDLELRTSIGLGTTPSGGLGADIKTAMAGDILNVQFLSPAGGYDFFPPLLVAELFGTGLPPVGPPAPFNTVHFNPTSPMLTALVNGNVVTPVGFSEIIVPGNGNTHVYSIPVGLTGTSIMLQCLTVDNAAANGFFAITSGHEIQFI